MPLIHIRIAMMKRFHSSFMLNVCDGMVLLGKKNLFQSNFQMNLKGGIFLLDISNISAFSTT